MIAPAERLLSCILNVLGFKEGDSVSVWWTTDFMFVRVWPGRAGAETPGF